MPTFGVPRSRIAQMFGRVLVLGLCLVAAIAPDVAVSGVPAPSAAATSAAPVPEAYQVVPAAMPVANSTPARLVISEIGVNARIEARGLDASRAMLTPRDYRDVAWYNQGPVPGQPGNAL